VRRIFRPLLGTLTVVKGSALRSARAVRDPPRALKHGTTIEDAATHLCRSGTVDDVRRKAKELGFDGSYRAIAAGL
jgi:hypothetical protein